MHIYKIGSAGELWLLKKLNKRSYLFLQLSFHALDILNILMESIVLCGFKHLTSADESNEPALIVPSITFLTSYLFFPLRRLFAV